MGTLPIRCTNPRCEYIFNSGIYVADVYDSSLNGIAGTCPKCGSKAVGLEGRFNFPGENNIEVISASEHSLQMLRDIAQKVKSGQVSEAEGVAQITEVAPGLGRYLRFLLAVGIPIASLIVAAVSLYIQFSDSRSSSEFQDELLKEMRKQTQVLELLQQGKDIHYHDGVYDEGARPPKPKADVETTGERSRPNRRLAINAKRRFDLKQRRVAFGGARSLHGKKCK